MPSVVTVTDEHIVMFDRSPMPQPLCHQATKIKMVRTGPRIVGLSQRIR